MPIETVTLATLRAVMNRQASEPAQETWRSNLRAWIQYFMEDLALTTDEAFADAINVSRPTITNIRNDKRPMGLKTLIKMHHHLGKQNGFTLERLVYGAPPKVGTHHRPQARNQAQ